MKDFYAKNWIKLVPVLFMIVAAAGSFAWQSIHSGGSEKQNESGEAIDISTGIVASEQEIEGDDRDMRAREQEDASAGNGKNSSETGRPSSQRRERDFIVDTGGSGTGAAPGSGSGISGAAMYDAGGAGLDGGSGDYAGSETGSGSEIAGGGLPPDAYTTGLFTDRDRPASSSDASPHEHVWAVKEPVTAQEPVYETIIVSTERTHAPVAIYNTEPMEVDGVVYEPGYYVVEERPEYTETIEEEKRVQTGVTTVVKEPGYTYCTICGEVRI